jgi:uncharacterized membrane protein
VLNLYLDGVSHAGAETKETASLALGEVILLSDAAVLEKDRYALCLYIVYMSFVIYGEGISIYYMSYI